MIGVYLAALWVAVSLPVSVLTGRVLRNRGEAMRGPYPLGEAELTKIVAMFDAAALVRSEPDRDGRVEIVFSEEEEAARFVAVAHRGRWGAVPFLEDVTVPLHVVGGPVTVRVTLLPAWRPVEGVAV